MKKSFLGIFTILIATSLSSFGQGILKITPEKPKAGEDITIVYEPTAVVPVKLYGSQFLGLSPQDLDFRAKRADGKYSATFKTDTAAVLVFFNITTGGVQDNNEGKGYWIELYENGKPRQNANVALSNFYQYYGEEAGVEPDKKKALDAVEKELTYYPENKGAKTGQLRLMLGNDKEEGNKAVQAEINAKKQKGLKTEDDYNYLSQLYSLAKEPKEIATLTEEKKAKFPNGKWVASEVLSKFYAEKDLVKKKEMYEALVQDINTKGNFSHLQKSIPNLQVQLLRAYLTAKDWDAFDKALNETVFEDQGLKASLLNSAAWAIYEKDGDLVQAEKYIKTATDYTHSQWKEAEEKRKLETRIKQAKSTHASYIDTYASILYKLGRYDEGFGMAKEAAITINDGKNVDLNNTYALLAKKVLKDKELKTELEKFIADGKANADITAMVKEIYVKENKSDTGFDLYLSKLEQAAKEKMRKELEEKMESKLAPVFSLVNLDGSTVKLEDLKGKVVIVDFWATWCGPCIASFPAMKAAQEKYKDNPNVKFVFINSWESVENKKEHVTNFVKKGAYPFDVLFDLDDKVIGSYGVSGIPTKFIIDKKGNIRFTSIGFGGSNEKLVTELSMMIDMASE